MARKVSDMVLLLGSRGRSRGGKSSGHVLGRVMRWVFGGSNARSSSAVSSWTVLVVAMLCFAGGYVVGDHFGAGKEAPGKQALKAGPVGELDTRVLSSTAFLVAAYEGMPAEQARPKAKALAEYLRARGLAKAKPYEAVFPKGSLWLVVVYYGTEAERVDTSGKLVSLPVDVPDDSFVQLRETKRDDGKVWPFTFEVR